MEKTSTIFPPPSPSPPLMGKNDTNSNFSMNKRKNDMELNPNTHSYLPCNTPNALFMHKRKKYDDDYIDEMSSDSDSENNNSSSSTEERESDSDDAYNYNSETETETEDESEFNSDEDESEFNSDDNTDETDTNDDSDTDDNMYGTGKMKIDIDDKSTKRLRGLVKGMLKVLSSDKIKKLEKPKKINKSDNKKNKSKKKQKKGKKSKSNKVDLFGNDD